MTENLAARGEGLAGLVAALNGVINERDTELDMMHCAYSSGVGREAWHDGVREAWTRFALVKERARQAMVAALEAAAPPSTAHEQSVESLENARRWCFSMRQDEWLGDAIQELQSWKPAALYRVVAALATPSPQAPQEQCNAFSTTSAREQSSATASDNLSMADLDKAPQDMSEAEKTNYDFMKFMEKHE